MAKDKVYTGTGRRKTSVARVTLTRGTGKITINGRDVNEYFPHQTMVMDLTQPLDITGTRDIFDVTANVSGGGCSGQAGAVRHGITKALLIYDAATPVESENSYFLCKRIFSSDFLNQLKFESWLLVFITVF